MNEDTETPESDGKHPNRTSKIAPIAIWKNTFPTSLPLTPAFPKNGTARDARRLDLAKRKSLGQLTAHEQKEFAELQKTVFAFFEKKFGRPLDIDERLERLEKKYNLSQNSE